MSGLVKSGMSFLSRAVISVHINVFTAAQALINIPQCLHLHGFLTICPQQVTLDIDQVIYS